MAGEPSYPEDTPVGVKAEAEARSDDAKSGDEAPPAESETIAAVKASREASGGRTRGIVTGAAIGVGSAALVAALLYARSRRNGAGPERK